MNLVVGDIIFVIFIVFVVFFRLIIFFYLEGMIVIGLCKFVIGGNVVWIGVVFFIFSLVVIVIEWYYVVMYFFSNRRNFIEFKFKVCKG